MESEDMINSTKRQKNCAELTIEETKDRISNLPNEILGHILSFLPTKYAVRTCILSTRWEYLWTSLHNLDFDDELLLHWSHWTKHISRRKITLSFTSFVHRVLFLCNMSYIQRFRLKCGRDYKYSHVNAWISAALQRNVQELDLSISMEDSRVLPRRLFTCATLVSLKLDAELVLYVPPSVALPKLKTLLLKKIIFLDDDSAQVLFSSCPVLEELLILDCGCEFISVFNISGLSLKRLTIFHSIYEDVYEYKVMIDAPMLEYLQLNALNDNFLEGSPVKNVESLIEAYIQFDLFANKIAYGVFELIRAISNVKVLHLFGQSSYFSFLDMKNFLSSHRALPMFPNVTRLELGEEIAWQLLQELLQNSPNLEALSLHTGLDPLDIGKFHWNPPEQVPHCLLHHLKTITIWEFSGHKEELKLVEYFLKNSNVLHQLKINTHGKVDWTVFKKLLTFPRSSNLCQVVLSDFF